MYYEPTNIPTYYRQPSRRAGIALGKSALVAGGINEGLLNAEHEGGPRNGVLTAIEDFLETTHRGLELFAVRGTGGLGLVIARATLHDRPDVSAVVELTHDSAFAVSITPRYASRFFD